MGSFRQAVVKGSGPESAKILAVGEAPGAEEVAQGKPFVGSAGRLLRSMLASVGVDWKAVRLENVMQTQPPHNDFSFFYVDGRKRKTPKPELSEGIVRLMQDIKRMKPNVVVALGAEPLRALTGKRNIGAWRGSIIDTTMGKVVPTFHPAGVLRMYENRAIVEMDLQRVVLESLTRACVLPRVTCLTNPTYEQAIDWLDSASRSEKLAFDIETADKHVRCIALSYKVGEAFCIPFISRKRRSSGTFVSFKEPTHSSHWSLREEMEILRMLARVLESEQVGKIAQNFPFDSTILGEDLGIDVRGLYMDTMLVHHACYCEFPKSLDFLCSMYTQHPRYSDYDASVDEEVWRYNCMDSLVTFECAETIEREARELHVWDFYKQHIEPEMIGLTRMQNRGALIDIQLRARLAARQMFELAKSLEEMKQATGVEFNPGSSKQVQEYLYETLKIPKKYHKSTGAVTADEETLKGIAARYPRHSEAVRSILGYRKAQKLLGTFLTSRLSRGDGGDNRDGSKDGVGADATQSKLRDGSNSIGGSKKRRSPRNIIKTSYSTSGTTSGRISSSKTIFGEGGNLQQIPKSNIRRMFVAREGCVLVKSDLSQAEFRVVAWLANIRRIIQRYADDPQFDIHRWNASNIYNVAEAEVSPVQRSSSKAIVHGGNYGLGVKKAISIAEKWGIEITWDEMRRGKEIYVESMPEISRWWKEIEDELQRTRVLVTPFGRRRMFLGRLDNALFRRAYSYLPQSTVGDIVNRAVGRAEYVLPKGNYPLLQVHDEIVWELEASRLKELLPIVRGLMTYELRFDGVPEPLVIPVEVTVGSNWYDQEEVT